MKQTKLAVALKATLLGVSLGLAPSAFAADKELLDILKVNGSISQAQYDQLIKKADQPSESSELLKKMAWAGKIKVSGDLRVRQEYQTEDTGTGSGDGEDRQRYRARVGVYADVTDNVQAGVRLVSNGGATSTNETLGDGFANDTVYFDLAYINWQPLDGLEVIGGKMAQPWQKNKTGLVWDDDVNPEGGALRYTTKLGDATLIGTVGHLVLNDIDGFSFDEDQTIQFAQLATEFGETVLGVGMYVYDEDKQAGLISGGGNDSTEYAISEIFGETTFNLGLPIKLYGQYAKNNDANGVNSGEDTAWLLGTETKLSNWKASYDYRETELNAVNGAFNDSDFAGGRTDAKGHRLKLSYKIDNNFSVGTTYFKTEVGQLNGDLDVDTWQIDLAAKF
tara:strand:+ start:6847 stop:8025 length:1179 start_codon:yes stop_codon:yes gene_type:complete